MYVRVTRALPGLTCHGLTPCYVAQREAASAGPHRAYFADGLGDAFAPFFRKPMSS